VLDQMDKKLKESQDAFKKLLEKKQPDFKRKGNKFQYDFADKVAGKLREAKEYIPVDAPQELSELINEGESLLEERKKHLVMADQSEYSWTKVSF
jgi:hypothetical protein